MENISIFFEDIKAPDAEQYLADRIALLHYANGETFAHEPGKDTRTVAADYAKDMAANMQPAIGIPMAAPVDMSKLEGPNAAQIRDEYACMIKEIKAQFPLTDNEHVAQNEISYLSEAFNGNRAGSVVLRQTTNLSVCSYVYPFIIASAANSNDLQFSLNYDIPEVPSVQNVSTDLLGFDFTNLPLKIAEGIAGVVGGQIGEEILHQLWPQSSKMKDDWVKITAILEKIVRTELVANNLSIANTKLSTYMEDINTEYESRKNNGTSNDGLFDYLKDKDNTLKEIVGTFMYTALPQYDMEAVTLGNFLLIAGIHLAHLQEKARRKPNNVEKGVVSAWAKTYADYAEAAIPRIVSARSKFISTGLYAITETRCSAVSRECTNHPGYEFADDYTGYTKREIYSKKSKDSVHNRMAGERFAYIARTESNMRNELESKVNPIIRKWRVLINKPLPQIAAVAAAAEV
jgi:hypothetical protein